MNFFVIIAAPRNSFELEQFLREEAQISLNKLENVQKLFEENDLTTWLAITDLTDNTLKELGLSVGHRNSILRAVHNRKAPLNSRQERQTCT